MKKLLITALALLTLTASSVLALDFQMSTGTFDTFKLSIPVGMLQINGSVDYKSLYGNTIVQGASTKFDGVIYMPGVGLSVNLINKDKISVYVGGDYNLCIPVANVKLSHESADLSNQEKFINDSINEFVDEFKGSTFDVYMNMVYEVDPQFGVVGTFGYKGINTSFKPYEASLGTLYTQLGVNFKL